MLGMKISAVKTEVREAEYIWKQIKVIVTVVR